MLPLRRSALRTTQILRVRPQFRHDSSDAASGHAASAGKAEPTHHDAHPAPENEYLGRGFYIAIALIPLTFALYKLSNSSYNPSDPSTQPYLTRLIHSYSNYKERWSERNAMHTAMMEQAAHDRNLFQSTPGSRMIDLKFPEIFNTGSPYNVGAGHSADLSELIAHYERLNQQTREEVAERQRQRKEEEKK